MQIIITAVGPDNRGLADPIVHRVTELGANISEIQMFNHDEQSLFSMLVRIELPTDQYRTLADAMEETSKKTSLSIRTWSPEIKKRKPRIAICATYRQEPPLALLRAVRDQHIQAEIPLMLGNREKCRSLAEQFDIPWFNVGKPDGSAEDEKMISLCDQHAVDYIILARYMRILPAASCWKYAGGRIINLHHGLLPSFPGIHPYHEAFSCNMLTYGATCHFIVPELDAGNQIIYQSTFTVPPGMPRAEIILRGQADNEPHCLVEGVRRVIAGEVGLRFNRVVAIK